MPINVNGHLHEDGCACQFCTDYAAALAQFKASLGAYPTIIYFGTVPNPPPTRTAGMAGLRRTRRERKTR
jgi:hypothetical protein